MDIESIKPFNGLGDLSFGTYRNEIRAILGNDFITFSRVSNKEPNIDFYISIGLQLSYEESNRLEFIEVMSPGVVYFEGFLITNNKPAMVIQAIEDKGHKCKKDDVGCDFPDLGFGLYIIENEIEAVSIYRKGYYDTD